MDVVASLLHPDLGWLVGAGIGVGGAVVGWIAIRALLRRRKGWWKTLAAPLLLSGPAVGVVIGSALTGGPVAPGEGPGQVPVNVAWSVLLFFGTTAAFGMLRAFLQSHFVTDVIGLRIPVLLLDLGKWLVWLGLVFAIVGAIWGKTEWFSALFTASAIGTVIIGLALQETLQSFVAGIGIVTERVYGIGDWIHFGDQEGEVVQISRRTTRLRSRSGDMVTIPNRTIGGSTVRNLSKPSRQHAELVYVSAPYDVPPNRVRQVLREAVREVAGVLESPEPALRLHRYADSGIDYEVKFWIEDLARLHDIRSDVLVQVWYHFKRAGIEFPYPVREVRELPAAPRTDPEETVRSVLGRLRTVPFFQAVPPEVLGLLARDARIHVFATGERVVAQGQAGDACYVVDAGRLEVLVSDGGAARTVATLKEGDLFGEMSLLTGEPRTATVRAVADSRLVSVGAASLREALQRAPDLASRLAEAAALRREGLASARASLDGAARERVDAGAQRLVTAIRRFFQLPDPGVPRA